MASNLPYNLGSVDSASLGPEPGIRFLWLTLRTLPSRPLTTLGQGMAKVSILRLCSTPECKRPFPASHIPGQGILKLPLPQARSGHAGPTRPLHGSCNRVYPTRKIIWQIGCVGQRQARSIPARQIYKTAENCHPSRPIRCPLPSEWPGSRASHNLSSSTPHSQAAVLPSRHARACCHPIF